MPLNRYSSARSNNTSLASPAPGWGAAPIAGYLAAGTVTLVSIAANARYGWSLGAGPLDKAIYAATSVAIDAFKVLLPLLALGLWSNHRRLLAICGIALWLGCVAWSSVSAFGFALSTRAEVVAERTADARTRSGWEATVQRNEAQLSTLSRVRPASVIKAELAGVVVPANIWLRTRECSELTLAESQRACAPVVQLRQELAAAEAAEELERRVAAGRAQLAGITVVAVEADLQAAALARLTGQSEPTIRTALAILLAALVELGSALGFTIVAVAARGNPPSTAQSEPPPTTTPRHPSRRPTIVTSRVEPSQPATTTADAIRRWALTCLDIEPTAAIPARAAYHAYSHWCREQGMHPCSETAFGTRFTAEIGGLGGHKEKHRTGARYVGVALADPAKNFAAAA
jgi:hypothetical protein